MDTEFLKSFLYLGSVGVVTGIVQVLKPIITNPKWYGILAIFVGIGLNLMILCVLEGITGAGTVTAVLYGIIAGLAASGAYSTGQIQQGKTVVNKEELKALTEVKCETNI